MSNSIQGKHARFFHRTTVNCSVETAWEVLTDHEAYSEFTESPTRLIREGQNERNGLGAIRELGLPEFEHTLLREVVNYWEPLSVFGYHVISDKDYQPSHHQGIVRFFPKGEDRCELVYSMRMVITPTMEEMLPTIYDEYLKGFNGFMRDIESECERRGHPILIPSIPPAVKEEAIEWQLERR